MGKKAIILAGGISSRMKKSAVKADTLDVRVSDEVVEQARDISKGMMDFSDRPFLDYSLYNLREAQ